MSLIKKLRTIFFGQKTLSSIVAPLNKIKEELETLVSTHADEINEHSGAIAELQAKIEDKEATIATAKKVRDNVSKLLA